MPGYIAIYEGLFVAPDSIESFQLNYRQPRGTQKQYRIEIVFKSGHTVKFEDLSEEIYKEIVEKLQSV